MAGHSSHSRRQVIPLLLVLLGAAAPTQSGWMADCSKAEIPTHPASGMIHGTKFTVEKAELTGGETKDMEGKPLDHVSYFLRLRQGKEFFADRDFLVFIAVKPGDRLDGKSYSVQPGKTFEQAGAIKVKNIFYPPIQGVHMSYKVPNDRLPKAEMADRYSLRLVFGKAQGGRLPGRVYICIPDSTKSYVAGTFAADVHR